MLVNQIWVNKLFSYLKKDLAFNIFNISTLQSYFLYFSGSYTNFSKACRWICMPIKKRFVSFHVTLLRQFSHIQLSANRLTVWNWWNNHPNRSWHEIGMLLIGTHLRNTLVVMAECTIIFLQFRLRSAFGFVERLTFTLQCCDIFFDSILPVYSIVYSASHHCISIFHIAVIVRKLLLGFG